MKNLVFLDTNVIINKKEISNNIYKSKKINFLELGKKLFTNNDWYITEMVYHEVENQIWGNFFVYKNITKNQITNIVTEEILQSIENNINLCAKEVLENLKNKIFPVKENHGNFIKVVKNNLDNMKIDLSKIKDRYIAEEIKTIQLKTNCTVTFVTDNTKDFRFDSKKITVKSLYEFNKLNELNEIVGSDLDYTSTQVENYIFGLIKSHFEDWENEIYSDSSISIIVETDGEDFIIFYEFGANSETITVKRVSPFGDEIENLVEKIIDDLQEYISEKYKYFYEN